MRTLTLRSLTTGLVLALALALLSSLAQPPAPAAASWTMTDAVNAERAKVGARALTRVSELDRVAMAWSTQMARSDALAHNPNLSAQVQNWEVLGENVGWGGTESAVFTALMRSTGHRANILDRRFTEIGIGVTTAGGKVWVTQVFRRATVAGTPTARPVATWTYDGVQTRLSGTDRYATAAAVSRELVPQPGPGQVVFLASGAGYADALTASAQAGARRAPVLLVGASGIPPVILTELRRLNPSTVYLVGGPSAVSAEVADQVAAQFVRPVRLSGSDRYETAAAVARVLSPNPTTVFVASGENFPDALAGSAAAGTVDAPILLTRFRTIPTPSLDALRATRPTSIVLLGGPGAVSTGVEAELRGLGFATVTRVGGADRYATAALVSRRWFSTSGPVVVATGRGFADALAGGALAASSSAPLLLTAGSVPSSTRSEIDRRNASEVTLVGGRSVVADLPR